MIDNEDFSDPTQKTDVIKAPNLPHSLLSALPKPAAGLYLVATPIGNLRDITLRALDLLATVDIVACEDTRMTGKLFALLGLRKKLFAYHDHNENAQLGNIMDMIRSGQSVALVSDAGMPMISDPGYRLVRACADNGLPVTSLPGANAPLMALQLSGLPSDCFSFAGFLPSKRKARRDVIEKWKDSDCTLIFFESAARVEESCRDLLDVLGNRSMALARELTKKFEDVWRGPVADILARLEQDGAPKGEIVLVIDRPTKIDPENFDPDQLIITALSQYDFKEAVTYVTKLTGLPKKQIYNRALELKEK